MQKIDLIDDRIVLDKEKLKENNKEKCQEMKSNMSLSQWIKIQYL